MGKAAVIALICLLASPMAQASTYLTLYWGRYTDDDLLQDILAQDDIVFESSHLLSAAYARSFSHPSPTRQWEWEGQWVKHFGQQSHWEANLLVIHRWKSFPWDKYLRTTLAMGDGLSYASRIPPLELASHTNEGASKWLNYLLLEASFQAPQVDSWSLVVRIHHRSGIRKLINNVKGGSNHIGVGIRWRF